MQAAPHNAVTRKEEHMKDVKSLITVGLREEALSSMEFSLKSVRTHTEYKTKQPDGKTLEMLTTRDDYEGYARDDQSNYGETLTVVHLGATDSTYATIRPGTPCKIEAERVELRCSGYIDKDTGKLKGYLSGVTVYGKVTKAGGAK